MTLSDLGAEKARRDEALLRLLTSPKRASVDPRPVYRDPLAWSRSSEEYDRRIEQEVQAVRKDRMFHAAALNFGQQASPLNELGDPDAMIRKRTADGGEVVSPGQGGNYTPSTPSFGVDENGSPMMREPSLKLRENFPISHPRQRRNSNGSMRDNADSPSYQYRERRDSFTSVDSGAGEDKKKRLNFGIFRGNTTPNSKEKDTADWVSIESKSSGDSDKKRSGIRATLSRLSGGSGSKKDSNAVFQDISKRTDERRKGGTPGSGGHTLNRKGSNESIRSVASVSSSRGPTTFSRSKTVGATSKAVKHEKKSSRSVSSRIPTAASSPSPSRPNSQQSVNRRPYSTVSSSSDRIPLRSPSQTSIRSRPSAPNSPSASSHHPSHPPHLQVHRHQRSVPVNGKSSIPTPAKMTKPPPTFKRADSAPSQHSRTVSAPPQTKVSGNDGGNREGELEVKKKLDTAQDGPATAEDGDETPKKEQDNDDTPAGNRARNMSDPFAPRSKLDPVNTDHSQVIFGPPEGTPTGHLDQSEHLRSPALSDFDELHDPGRVSPLYGRGSDGKGPKRSPLEEEDSDTESLQALMHDEGYTELLNKQQEEDDTFNLLSDLRSRTITKPAQDLASPKEDKTKEEETAKLLNKLKTLHLELRSARQGIDYIERRLNGGASSDDESEWVDEDDTEHERVRDRKRRLKAPATESPQSEASSEPEKPSSQLKHCILFVTQFALIWMLLELAIL